MIHLLLSPIIFDRFILYYNTNNNLDNLISNYANSNKINLLDHNMLINFEQVQRLMDLQQMFEHVEIALANKINIVLFHGLLNNNLFYGTRINQEIVFNRFKNVTTLPTEAVENTIQNNAHINIYNFNKLECVKYFTENNITASDLPFHEFLPNDVLMLTASDVLSRL